MATVTLTCECGATREFDVRDESSASLSYTCPACRTKEQKPTKQEERRGKLYQEGDPGRALRDDYPAGAR